MERNVSNNNGQFVGVVWGKVKTRASKQQQNIKTESTGGGGESRDKALRRRLFSPETHEVKGSVGPRNSVGVIYKKQCLSLLGI